MKLAKWFHNKVQKYLRYESKEKNTRGFLIIKYFWNGYIFIVYKKGRKYKKLTVIKNFKSVKGFQSTFS